MERVFISFPTSGDGTAAIRLSDITGVLSLASNRGCNVLLSDGGQIETEWSVAEVNKAIREGYGIIDDRLLKELSEIGACGNDMSR